MIEVCVMLAIPPGELEGMVNVVVTGWDVVGPEPVSVVTVLPPATGCWIDAGGPAPARGVTVFEAPEPTDLPSALAAVTVKV